MASFLKTALSGVGTAAGFALGGPGGAALGGTLGNLAGGALSDGSDGGRGQGGQANGRGDRLRELFEERVRRFREQSPTETATFRSGTGALREAIGDQRRRDAETAAARGLTGSQLEIAQQRNRVRTRGAETRRLLGESERRLASDQQSALRGLLSAAGLEEDIRARRARRKDRRTSRLATLAGSALQSGAEIFAARQFANRQQSSTD